jgi:HAD superfamily hydrolase (TIGR01459 family)
MLTDHFAPLADRYDIVLCDVWGVVHNGIVASAETIDALTRFRAKGGAVMLVTNAPRPGSIVQRMLERFSVPPAAYDGIVSSGDVSRHVVADRLGQSIFHIGPERDEGIFDDLPLRFAPAEEADYVVCTGLFYDESDELDIYDDLLAKLRDRNLFMLCANPDLVVERGDERFHCAGAIADLYERMGGEVLYAGKPHQPIYDEAIAKAEGVLGRKVALSRVVAIGDSMRTDIVGAARAGIDSVFVTGGIHAEELGSRDAPDTAILAEILKTAGVVPAAIMSRLAW